MQTGWNVWSVKAIKDHFKNIKKVNFFKFTSKIGRKQNKKDLMRSWTIKLNNKNHYTNGLNMIQNQFLVKIS